MMAKCQTERWAEAKYARRKHGILAQEKRWQIVLLKHEFCQFFAFGSRVPLYNGRIGN
jgi:hypothetical protein